MHWLKIMWLKKSERAEVSSTAFFVNLSFYMKALLPSAVDPHPRAELTLTGDMHLESLK